MGILRAPKNGSGLKNTPAVDTDMERHAELEMSLKCGVLILAQRKRLEAQIFWPTLAV